MNESPGTHLFSILHSILDSCYKRELQFAKVFNYHDQLTGNSKTFSSGMHISQIIHHGTCYNESRLEAFPLIQK